MADHSPVFNEAARSQLNKIKGEIDDVPLPGNLHTQLGELGMLIIRLSHHHSASCLLGCPSAAAGSTGDRSACA